MFPIFLVMKTIKGYSIMLSASQSVFSDSSRTCSFGQEKYLIGYFSLSGGYQKERRFTVHTGGLCFYPVTGVLQL